MPPDSRPWPGNLAEIDRLAQALAKDPGSKAFMPLAEEYGKAGMWPEAVAVLEDGLKLYPGFVTAMVALGRAYDQMNQPVKAKAVLEEAVKASPENLRAHRTLAKLYAAHGDIEAARRSCDIILAANRQDQEALALRATLEKCIAPSPQAPTAAATEPVTPPSQASLGETASSGPLVASPSDTLVAPAADQQGDPPSRNRSPSGIVRRLEGWLASIHANRRDQAGSGDSKRPSS